MRKKELANKITHLEESLERQAVEYELAESAFMRQLKDEQKGWASLGSATKRNRTWADVEDNLKECYTAWAVNPIAKSYCDYMRYFVIGKGTQITTEDGDSATEQIKYFTELNEWDILEKQICEELSRDGEVFVRFHDMNKLEMQASVSRITLIDPLEVQAIDCPEVGNPKRYRRVYSKLGDMDDSGNQTSETVSEWIPASEIIHIKVNTSYNELRGRSDLLVVLPWLKQLKAWIDNMSRRNYFMAAFNWFVKCSGGVKPSDITAKYPTGPAQGTTLAHTPNEEWTASVPDMKWADTTNGARAIKLIVMAGYKMPESWFGDTGESNLATTQALSMPTLRAFLDRQDVLKYYFSEIIKRGARVEDVEVEFPEIVTEEARAKATALNNLSQAILNFQTADIASKESLFGILSQFVDSLDSWTDDESGVGEKTKIEKEEQEESLATAQGRTTKGQAGLVLPPMEAPGGSTQPPNETPVPSFTP